MAYILLSYDLYHGPSTAVTRWGSYRSWWCALTGLGDIAWRTFRSNSLLRPRLVRIRCILCACRKGHERCANSLLVLRPGSLVFRPSLPLNALATGRQASGDGFLNKWFVDRAGEIHFQKQNTLLYVWFCARRRRRTLARRDYYITRSVQRGKAYRRI